MSVYILWERGNYDREYRLICAFRAENRKAAEKHVARLNRLGRTKITTEAAARKLDYMETLRAVETLTKREGA